MAEKSMLWSAPTSGDGTSGYTQDETTRLFRHTFGDYGVLKGLLNELQVTGSSSPLSINTGSAWVYGFFYWNDSSKSLAITTPSVGTTGHRVILRADWTAKTVRIVDLASPDGTSSFPALTQNPGTVYEISLATFTITTGGVITLGDARTYLHMNTMLDAGRIDAASITKDQIQNRSRRFFIFPHRGAFTVDNRGLTLPDGASSTVEGYGYIPYDLDDNSSLLIKPVLLSTITGNVYMSMSASVGGVGENYNAQTASDPLTARALTANVRSEIGALSPTPGYSPGDYVYVSMTRDATNVLDTIGGNVYLFGWMCSYVADM